MKTDDFDYYLPLDLIAQTPLDKRSDSRLLCLNKDTGEIEESHFYNILDYLDKNSVLVLNNTKVVPARIIGEKEITKAKIELLILKDLGDNLYECLAKPQKRLKVGTKVFFKDGLLVAEIKSILDEGIVHAKFIYDGIFYEVLDKVGEVPLPPYIHEKLKNKDRYQTVYSKIEGSSAAPTAGLHFTKELLEKVKESGIEVIEVTLNIGLGTFRPVVVDDVEKHDMHSEKYHVSEYAAERLNLAKKQGKKIIALGTTSLRTLEANITKNGCFKAEEDETKIFIYPGYEFKAVDELITNFHLPKSTLVMLVSALAGKENIMNAYKYAVDNKFRFFSFGDAMYIHTNHKK